MVHKKNLMDFSKMYQHITNKGDLKIVKKCYQVACVPLNLKYCCWIQHRLSISQTQTVSHSIDKRVKGEVLWTSPGKKITPKNNACFEYGNLREIKFPLVVNNFTIF